MVRQSKSAPIGMLVNKKINCRSFIRFPKWAHTFENILTFDFKTRQPYALLFYTDDARRNGNYYEATITNGHLKLSFRLGTNTRNAQVQHTYSVYDNIL
jgi:hypothetical protein